MGMTWADEVIAGHPFVVAHRGASGARPEHTLAAYDLALKQGADGVECDVRLTRDGHLVCVHDRRLDRTSTGAGLVSTMTLDQLRELEYGAWHDSWRPDGAHGDTSLLTLDALISLVLDWKRPVKVFIETKHPVRYGSLVESKVLALLQRFGIAQPASADRSRAVVMSFSAAAVWRIRRAAPLLPTVLLGKTARYLASGAASAVGATAVGPSLAVLRNIHNSSIAPPPRGERCTAGVSTSTKISISAGTSAWHGWPPTTPAAPRPGCSMAGRA
ncbi:putative glycerophosphoryl diester phosphodiesterase 1 [Mycobacterium marinum]|nr:putative glycerophosphoryl diester phosphodiesterase 1 [Mycobacterium marinum]